MPTLLLSIPGSPAAGSNLPKLPYSYAARVSDTFSGGNVADINGRATDSGLGGVAAMWQSGPANSYAISGGRLVRGSNASGIGGGALNVGNGDTRMLAVLAALPSTNLFLDLRKVAPDLGAAVTACYRVQVNSAGAVVLQRKPVSGSAVPITTGTYTLSAGGSVGVLIVGNSLGLIVNGAVVETVTDSSPLTGNYFEIYQGSTATVSMASLRFDTPS